MVPALAFELVAVAGALAGQVLLVAFPVGVPGGMGAHALDLQFVLDLLALGAGAFALGLPFEFPLFLELAVERGALDKVVPDAEGAAHAGVGLLLRLGELVALVGLDGGRGSLLAGGEEAFAEGADLGFDLLRVDAVVLEGDLEFEALCLDCALALVFEDVLVGLARGERLAVQVGRRRVARPVPLAEAVAG